MGTNAQIPPAISCPGRMRSLGAFAAPLESLTFCRRNRKWKPRLLFSREPISRRRASLTAAIFFLRQHSGKQGTLARAEHRASLHLQIPARELRFRPNAPSLEGGAPATPGSQEFRAPCPVRYQLQGDWARCSRERIRSDPLSRKGDLQIAPAARKPPLLDRAKYRLKLDRALKFDCRCRTRAAIRFGRRKIPAGMAIAPATNRDRQCRHGRRTVPECLLGRRAHSRCPRVDRGAVPSLRLHRAEVG